MHDKFLKEAEALEGRWQDVAVLLENQRSINEGPPDPKKMKRIHIPLIRRIYPSLMGYGPVEDNGTFGEPTSKPPGRRRTLRSLDDEWAS